MRKRRHADPDQTAVYEAEEAVFIGTAYEELVNDKDIITLADELFSTDWWQSQNIPIPELLMQEKGEDHSVARIPRLWGAVPPQIRFCENQVEPWTLAHEASHIACSYLMNKNGVLDFENHGREFRYVYTDVASLLLGAQAASDLAGSFKRWGLAAPDVLAIDGGAGIFPRWRNERAVAEMQRLIADAPVPPTRINGAIAL